MYRISSNYSKELEQYLENISQNHCPYISKSRRNNSLYFSLFNFENEKLNEELFFYIAILFVEGFRLERGRNNDLFYCENIIIKCNNLNIIEQELIFLWVHSNLKALYTEKGILFGKFWPNEISIDKNGKEIQPPPYLLLSIRSKISNIDQRFFEKSKPLLADFFNSIDDNKFVLEYFRGKIVDLTNETSESIIQKAKYFSQTELFKHTIKNITINKFSE